MATQRPARRSGLKSSSEPFTGDVKGMEELASDSWIAAREQFPHTRRLRQQGLPLHQTGRSLQFSESRITELFVGTRADPARKRRPSAQCDKLFRPKKVGRTCCSARCQTIAKNLAGLTHLDPLVSWS